MTSVTPAPLPAGLYRAVFYKTANCPGQGRGAARVSAAVAYIFAVAGQVYLLLIVANIFAVALLIAQPVSV